MEATCQCGSFKFTVPFPSPLFVSICHCDQCKLLSSSGYYIGAIYPEFEFLPKDKEQQQHVSIWSRDSQVKGSMLHGYSCKTCGNRMAHVADRGAGTVTISPTHIKGFDWSIIKNGSNRCLQFWTSRAIVPVITGIKTYEEQGSEEEIQAWLVGSSGQQ